jgi:cellulose synthase/poly-beta-1,6-N-acetylglucosamine synthase-like glycosyltransferase
MMTDNSLSRESNTIENTISNQKLPVTVRKTVSVVLPVRNEAAYIEGSLQSVLCQDYPTELMEIIVVDGMSTDSTRDIVQELQRNTQIYGCWITRVELFRPV